MFVFLNGKFVSAASAKIPVFDPGFTHGEGLFETILIRDSRPTLLREHYLRLTTAASKLKIRLPLSFTALQTATLQLIRKNKLSKGFLRITLTPETLLITTRPWLERPSSASATFVRMERCLPQLKTLNYLPTVLAQREAEERGFDEALLVDRAGYVTEGSRTNIFWVQNRRLFTPPLGVALPGVTREKVIELAKKLRISCREQKLRPTELRSADEIFLTNAPMEIWPVTRLERKKLAIGPITQKLQEAYGK